MVLGAHDIAFKNAAITGVSGGSLRREFGLGNSKHSRTEAGNNHS